MPEIIPHVKPALGRKLAGPNIHFVSQSLFNIMPESMGWPACKYVSVFVIFCKPPASCTEQVRAFTQISKRAALSFVIGTKYLKLRSLLLEVLGTSSVQAWVQNEVQKHSNITWKGLSTRVFLLHSTPDVFSITLIAILYEPPISGLCSSPPPISHRNWTLGGA